MAKQTVKASKYGNKKVVYKGETFDSHRELKRWKELELLDYSGEIFDLCRQVKFELVPKQQDKNGKAIRSINYVADFVYKQLLPDGSVELVVEDTKGFKTETYKMKWKLMKQVHNIEVREV